MKYLSTLILLSSSLIFASSLSKEPTSSSLIVYNDGVALVHEQRDLSLQKEDKEIVYSPVANTIITDSVNISLPKEVTLYSQQFRYDQLNLQKLLDAHIDKKVKVDRDEFTLLSHQSKTALLKDKKNQIISVEPKEIIFSTIPSTLLTKPSLVYNIETRKSLDSKIEIDYLIRNLSWKSDYILNIHGDKANLIGWISIDNHSGKSYLNTDLHVLAGDVNTMQVPQRAMSYAKDMVLNQSVEHQAHEGYHFYSVPFKVDISDQEKTQIKFLSKNDIDIKRLYKVQTSDPLTLNTQVKHSVAQSIEMQKLDTPLPKGVVRTYSPIKSQKIFIGESYISHTPKETSVELAIGNSFDLALDESIFLRSDTKEHYDTTIKYTLKNSSDEKKTVEILVPFNKSSSSVIKTKEKFSYKNGNLVSFKIKLDANKEKSFNVNFISKKHIKG
ncbi:MAG: hypothetical protein M0Q24_02250 [Sulfurimonas sp.]|uniref:DUF4139 domain-containing protein n=1 Tax=Sulfurimonas sp. TaxID=2022749 RepID=UPI0025DF95C6|nr:hypothetical protein [Sulfurimonas sp.]MCK9490885.1 hypothetical protein [Sulfurimonas sp.]